MQQTVNEKTAFLFIKGACVREKAQDVWKDAMETIALLRNEGFGYVILKNISEGDAENDLAIHTAKHMIQASDMPAAICGNIRRFEDIKKYIYAGALFVFCNADSEQEKKAYEEGVARFGEERVKLVPLSGLDAAIESGVSVDTLGLPAYEITVNASWEECKLNEQGMIPVVTQDYRTNEVLMVAYMNKEAFETTVSTGIMTYYSRSRQELWVKGLTSGNFQYVKSLYLDCDKDTLLAKVYPVGPACHTGAVSCFFNKVLEKPSVAVDPNHVLADVMAIIQDRKEHPKEGSYTNYLFDKGIDKILKKVGEEATEIVIAAKNPDPEEIKYEIADFLYHALVLMAEKGVSLEDIMVELANR